MKKQFRLLESKPVENSYRKMAVDEAVLLAVAEGRSIPTLRFYKWNKPAVAIGYFQSISEEVNTDKCEEDDVEIFRRMTGGGAVYKDPEGELNYSIIAPENHPKIPRDIKRSYKEINKCVINGLKEIGINAEHSGLNDITINGQKISGAAQTRKKGSVMQHGTILLDFNPDKMIKYLKIAPEKSEDKVTSNMKDRVTTLKKQKPNLDMNTLKEALKKGTKEQLNCQFTKEGLSEWEKQKSDELYREKYSTEEWNNKRE